MMETTAIRDIDHGRWPRNSIRLAIQRDDLELLQDLLTDRHGYSHEDLSSGLRLSAELGNEQCAAMLLGHNVLPNIHDSNGFTPLIIAAKYGHPALLKLLINAKCLLNKSTFRVRATALHWAATNGYLSCVQALITAGCMVDAQTIHGRTPLMLAARSDEPDIVHALLNGGADPSKGDLDNTTALHLAAEEGSLKCVTILLQASAAYNVYNRTGDTPLLKAAKQGHVAVVQELLSHPDVTLHCVSHSLSILHWTAYGGHHDCLRQLFKAYDKQTIPLNCQTEESYFGPQMVISEGVTPLMLACAGGHTDTVTILLEHGAETETVDVEGMTAMLYAIRNDYSRCVHTLLLSGADPDRVNLPMIVHDPEFDDILHNEEREDHQNMEEESGSEERQEEFRLTPLFYAIERDCRASLLALIRGSCNLDNYYLGQSNEYLQALELSVCRGRYNIGLMLLRLGWVRNLAMTPSVQHGLALLLQRDEPVFRSMMEQLSSPPPLMSQCRWFIRQQMGRRAIAGVHELPLPTSLVRYVNLDDVAELIS